MNEAHCVLQLKKENAMPWEETIIGVLHVHLRVNIHKLAVGAVCNQDIDGT